MTIASTVAVVLRLVARNISAAKYGMDDLFIVIALVRNAPVFLASTNAREAQR